MLDELSRIATLLPRSQLPAQQDTAAQVWLGDGHSGDPGVDLPFVAFVHEVGWGTFDQDRHHAPGFVERMERGTRAAVGRATRLITASSASKAQIERAYGVASDRIHVIHHGVDHDTFRRRGATRGSPAHGLVRRGTPYILHVSSLHPRKNLWALREAMSSLVAAGLPHSLVVVPAGAPDREDSSKLARELLSDIPGAPGRLVRVENPTDRELAELMSAAAVVCQPSLYEGFGMTVLEAMACGAPVIVSSRGSLPELVGTAGIVVDPTPNHIADALVRVAAQPEVARALGRASRARAAGFKWSTAASGWLSVLNTCARGT